MHIGCTCNGYLHVAENVGVTAEDEATLSSWITSFLEMRMHHTTRCLRRSSFMLFSRSRRFSLNSHSGKLSLQISDPMVLINNVASRYLSPSRIIIEFVDNSIDDMERFFNQEDNRYHRDVHINVHISSKKNYVRIVDNANGMSVETLSRLVSNVGDSSKRGKVSSSVNNVNGRFGFGMQSFRAAARQLSIVSRVRDEGTSDGNGYNNISAAPKLHKMTFTRDQSDDISPPIEVPEESHGGFPGGGKCGTDVLIEQWKGDWLPRCLSHPSSSASAKSERGRGSSESGGSLHEQLQRHFERLLFRENLHLCVIDDDENQTFPCIPMDYTLLSNASDVNANRGNAGFNVKDEPGVTRQDNIIQQRVYLPGKQKENNYIDVFFMILPKRKTSEMHPTHYPVNLFCNGRRVSSVRYLKSFMRKSKNAWVWNHPNLVGYVDASTLTPVITRDEFKKNAARSHVYHALYTLEEKLTSQLEMDANKYIQSDETFHKLESVINGALSLVVREEKRNRRNENVFATGDNTLHTEGTDGNTVLNDAGIVFSTTTDTCVGEEDDFQDSHLLSSDDDDFSHPLASSPVPSATRKPSDTSLARGVGLGVKFVKTQDDKRRAQLVGKYIEINVTHPDFVSRVSSKNGGPKLTERLLGYIANVVSAAYRSSVHSNLNSNRRGHSTHDTTAVLTSDSDNNDDDVVYDEMLDTIVDSSTRLEEKLQQKLPSLQREIDQITGDALNLPPDLPPS